MKITRWNNNQLKSPNAEQFGHVLELALWSECGCTEYLGVNGASKNELIDLLGHEISP
jgi:hypothetical protein